MRIGTQRGRTVATVLVVLLVVLAGCSGGTGGDGETTSETTTVASGSDGGGGDGGSSDGGSDASGGDDDDSGSSDGSDGGDGDTSDGSSDGSDGSDGGDGDTSDGSDDGSSTDGLDTFAENLRESGSYTVDYVVSVDSEREDQSGTFMGSARVDLEQETSLESFSVESPDQQGEFTFETYIPPGASREYVRLSAGDFTQYQTQQVSSGQFDPFGNPVAGGSGGGPSGFADIEDAEGFRNEGLVQTDEGMRQKYVIDSLSQLEEEALSDESIEVQDIYFEVLVDMDREIVTDYIYEITYESDTEGVVTVEFELHYTEVGSTTVPEPDWLDEARSQSGSSGKLAPVPVVG